MSRMCLQMPVCIVQTSLRLPPCICRQPLQACFTEKRKPLKTYAIMRVKVNVKVIVAVRQIVSAKFGGNEIILYLCGVGSKCFNYDGFHFGK